MVKLFKKNFKKALSVLLSALMVLSAAACKKQDINDKDENNVNAGKTAYEGIFIGGIDISGLSYNEAKELLEAELEDRFDIELSDGENSWDIDFIEIGGTVDFASALDKAFEIGKGGTEEENAEEIAQLKENPVDIPVSYRIDNEKLIGVLEGILAGTDFDIEKTAEKIIKSLEAGSTEPVMPASAAVEEDVRKLIGSFSTAFSAGDKNRNENLRVACEKINGMVIEVGGIFDMNEALGPQTAANGYKAAGVIENGKIVSAIAGGVCQVTTTIYNAAIFAELKIVERHNHSLMVGYVPLGRDAAVAGNYKNLRFQNDTDYPIYIEAYLEDNNVVCNIYGHEIHDEDRRVEFERVWIATIQKPEEKITEDPERYVGEREVTYTGKTGAKVDTYKLIYKGEELVSREWFSSSTYIATADEVTVGTKPNELYNPPVIGQPDVTEPPIGDITDFPIVPEVPVIPEIPDTPEVPEIPEVPENPELPEIPEIPSIGENEDVPSIGSDEIPSIGSEDETPTIGENTDFDIVIGE